MTFCGRLALALCIAFLLHSTVHAGSFFDRFRVHCTPLNPSIWPVSVWVLTRLLPPLSPSLARSYTSPDQLAKQGDEALAVGEFDKAIRLYSEAINGDSSNFQFVRACPSLFVLHVVISELSSHSFDS